MAAGRVEVASTGGEGRGQRGKLETEIWRMMDIYTIAYMWP